MIQRRMTYGNLDAVATAIQAYIAGKLKPVDTRGRQSAVWGQPTLTAYSKWRKSARQRTAMAHKTAVASPAPEMTTAQ
jgi:hypothetical protein